MCPICDLQSSVLLFNILKSSFIGLLLSVSKCAINSNNCNSISYNYHLTLPSTFQFSSVIKKPNKIRPSPFVYASRRRKQRSADDEHRRESEVDSNLASDRS